MRVWRAWAFLFGAAILLASVAAADPARSIYFVYDSSSSMWAKSENGQSKYELASATLQDAVRADLRGRTVFFRTYGADKSQHCMDTILVGRATTPKSAAEIAKQVVGRSPNGMSALDLSLRAAAKDVSGAASDIILITDGQTNGAICPGDPCALVQAWKDAGSPIKVHVVNFGQGISPQMSCIAAAQGTPIIDGTQIREFIESLAPPLGNRTISVPKKELDLLSWFAKTFWTDINQAQAALLTSVITLIGAGVAYFFLKRQIDSVRQTLIEAENRFKDLLQEMQKQLGELDQASSKIMERVDRTASQVSLISITVEKLEQGSAPGSEKA